MIHAVQTGGIFGSFGLRVKRLKVISFGVTRELGDLNERLPRYQRKVLPMDRLERVPPVAEQVSSEIVFPR